MKDTMEQFIEKYNNFTIFDEKGKAFVLQVIRSVYHSLLKEKRIPNLIENTILETEDYKAFLEKLS